VTAARFSIVMLLRMGAGLLVWASAFLMLYAGHALLCRLLSPASDAGLRNPVTAGLVVLAAVHLVAMLALMVLWWRHPPAAAPQEPTRTQRFRHRTEGLLLLISLAGLVYIAFPLLMTPPCVG